MKIIKKIMTVIISSVILCSCFSLLPVNAEQVYVYGNKANVFDLIAMKRSLINEDGNYTLTDYQQMSNFLLKKKSSVAKKVSISYDTEGCDMSSYLNPEVLDTIERYSGTSIIIPQASLKREGFIHGGWMYDGKVYKTGEYFTVPETDVLFVPYWYSNHVITYYAGDYDGIVGNKYATVSCTAGTNYDIAASSRFSRKGYKITGWLCSYDGLIYGPNSKYLVPDSDVTFTAIWQAAPAEISISANNGNYNDRYTVTGICGEEFVLPECEFENGTKVFNGWKYNGTVYQPGDIIIIPALLTGEKVVITATWK